MFDEESKDGFMAASTTSGLSLSFPAAVPAPAEARIRRPRRISPRAGRALEILGHAIEYLADELVYDGGPFSAGNPRLQAVQLLMARNREVYYACPEVPTIGERCRAFVEAVF